MGRGWDREANMSTNAAGTELVEVEELEADLDVNYDKVSHHVTSKMVWVKFLEEK